MNALGVCPDCTNLSPREGKCWTCKQKEQKNMKTIKVKLLDPIDGYEDVAEYRVPVKGEQYIEGADGRVSSSPRNLSAPWLCLTKKQTPLEKLGLKVGFGYISPSDAFLISGPEDAVRSWRSSIRGWMGVSGTCLLKPQVGCAAALTENTRSSFTESPLGSPELIKIFGDRARLPEDLERAKEVERLQGILERTQRDLENLK